MSRDRNRQALIDAGKQVLLEKGYSCSSLEAILQAAGVPKGSFYYYFSSKEDFALQVIDSFGAAFDEIYEQGLADPLLGPLERLRRHFTASIDRLSSQECRNGCPIGRLSQELADANEAFRERLEKIFAKLEDRVANCLKEAQEAGEIPPDLDPARLAQFWLCGWQGAILRSRIARSPDPLRNFLDQMFDHATGGVPPDRRTSGVASGSERAN